MVQHVTFRMKPLVAARLWAFKRFERLVDETVHSQVLRLCESLATPWVRAFERLSSSVQVLVSEEPTSASERLRAVRFRTAEQFRLFIEALYTKFAIHFLT